MRYRESFYGRDLQVEGEVRRGCAYCAAKVCNDRPNHECGLRSACYHHARRLSNCVNRQCHEWQLRYANDTNLLDGDRISQNFAKARAETRCPGHAFIIAIDRRSIIEKYTIDNFITVRYATHYSIPPLLSLFIFNTGMPRENMMETESVPVDPHLRKHNRHLSRDLRSTISFRNSSSPHFAYNTVISGPPPLLWNA